MRIAVAQMNTRAGDFDATVKRLVAYGSRAKELGVDLLVCPVAALMGPDPVSLAQNDGYLADAAAALGRLARELEVPSLIPFSFDAGGALVGDVALVRNGEVIPLALASWLGSDAGSDAEDLARFLLGDSDAAKLAADAEPSGPVCVSIGGAEVGVALGYEGLNAFVHTGTRADIICYLPIDGYDTDDEGSCLAPSVADGCYVSEAIEANAWLVAANAVGGYEDVVFCGGSFVMAPWGELAAVAPSFVEDLLVCEVALLAEGPLEEPVQAPAYDRTRNLWDACVLATRDQVSKRDLGGTALVLDGSLTSSALAALAVDAVGPLRVSALVCANDEAARADARELARNLNIRDVDELAARDLEQAVAALGGEADATELAAGLVEARLGAWAHSGDLLALSAADKTALAVGMARDRLAPVARTEAFAPFGDVYRSDVERLARYRNTKAPSIPAGVLSRVEVPAGLGLEELSATPELMLSELDAALLQHIERAGGFAELAAGRLGPKRTRLLLERVQLAEAQRRCGPAYPVVSTRSLAGLAHPVTDAWRDHERDEDSESVSLDNLVEALRDIASSITVSSIEPSSTDAGADDDTDERVSEVMGYLQDLAAGRSLHEQSKDDSGSDDPWPSGMFSDN